jgi:hypothetical protein
LSDRDLALLAVKVAQDKGIKNVAGVHVKVFVRIVKKYCDEKMKSF